VQYLSQIIQDEEIASIVPGRFNVLKAPRGIGKTTLMFDERILQFAREKKHVIYLIHNKVSRDSIVEKHRDKAIVYDTVNGWLLNRKNNSWGS
jgi:predicted AAA+ superfamily ATPase